MEFLAFLAMLASASTIWARPERERLAFGLLIAALVLMVFIFTLGTRTSILPGLNY